MKKKIFSTVLVCTFSMLLFSGCKKADTAATENETKKVIETEADTVEETTEAESETDAVEETTEAETETEVIEETTEITTENVEAATKVTETTEAESSKVVENTATEQPTTVNTTPTESTTRKPCNHMHTVVTEGSVWEPTGNVHPSGAYELELEYKYLECIFCGAPYTGNGYSSKRWETDKVTDYYLEFERLREEGSVGNLSDNMMDSVNKRRAELGLAPVKAYVPDNYNEMCALVCEAELSDGERGLWSMDGGWFGIWSGRDYVLEGGFDGWILGENDNAFCAVFYIDRILCKTFKIDGM